ncbi:methyltransferase [Alkalimonas amylolytica]|uniref:Ribosomal RNA large subunit methyltransferase G n=1 Tax=Alkalimonas amylolytica TaxID=152573 RepID=A0A1H3XCN8_ALKAM|nr:methyltransferase [Alkalimonas amylolytica]SDZ97176.1 16S rRNA (guanine1207-N2)-methyltransferase [Alkalimonas amylolytica]
MNTHFTLAEVHLQLKRWPAGTDFVNLQAWDTVDELLLTSAFRQLDALSAAERTALPVVLLNDQFGALSCTLIARYPELTLLHCSDSYVSQLACQANLQLNQLPTSQLRFIDSLQPLPDSVALVLLRVPRDHGFLGYQLQQLAPLITDSQQLIVAARARDIHKNLLQLFSQCIGPTTASLTLRKCRYLHCQPEPTARKQPPAWPKIWLLPDSDLQLVNHANVFSGEKLDIGARFFLQHLPATQAGETLVDLGCGNGVLGLCALAANSELNVIFSDESAMAIASARQSVQLSLPERLAHCTFLQDDGLSKLTTSSVDWVLCNPPFHQQDTVTTHLARQMFRDAWRVLKPGGILRIVANRHLPYAQELTRLFGGVRCLASQQKFVILESERKQ